MQEAASMRMLHINTQRQSPWGTNVAAAEELLHSTRIDDNVIALNFINVEGVTDDAVMDHVTAVGGGAPGRGDRR